MLWAVRRLLRLLDPATSLTRVVVEGVSPSDAASRYPGLLQGADLVEYHGGAEFSTADRVVVTQLKYSQRKPTQAWTPARLAEKGSRGQPGVVARLAEAFSAFRAVHDRADVMGRLRLRLVSNQPPHQKLEALIAFSRAQLGTGTGPRNLASLLERATPSERQDLKRLHTASGLSRREFTDFLRLLEFDDLGASERWEQEATVVGALADHLLDAAIDGSRALLDLVRKQALPKTRDSLGLGRADVLVRLGVPQWSALFPMPSRLVLPEQPIHTPDAKKVASALSAGSRLVVAHGDAGVGKTTTVAQLESALPAGSVVVLYDCFGGGEYLNASETRHLVEPALMQMINELGLRCGSRLLLHTPKQEVMLWRRLIEVLSEAKGSLPGSDSRIVLVVDAADNAVIAGRTRSQRTFVSDLASLHIPDGVSVVLTCRTHRVDELGAPDHAVRVELKGFDSPASGTHLRSRFPDADDSTCQRFHDNSGGNPRSQFYVLDPGRTDAVTSSAEAADLAKVTPSAIFQDLVKAAIDHAADPSGARNHLADLICLTRPVALEVFARVTGLSNPAAENFCRALVPGIRLEDGAVAFRDEDFETHLRLQVSEAEAHLAHTRLACFFQAHRDKDPLAATAVAEHLRLADLHDELMRMAIEDGQPDAIADPVGRLQVYLRRLELAMQVAERPGSRRDALRLTLLAARAARTDQAVVSVVRSRPDLAMRYGDRRAVARIYEAGYAEPWRGPLHLRVAGLYARLGHDRDAAEEMRLAEAWIRRWMDLESHERYGWEVSVQDIAAGAQAVYWMHGPDAAGRWLERWRPVDLMLEAAEALAIDVARATDIATVCADIQGLQLPAVVQARLLAALFVAGFHAPQELVRELVAVLAEHPPPEDLRTAGWTVDFLELVACVTRDCEQVQALIDLFGPTLPRYAPSQYQEMGDWHAPLRHRCLKAACAGREIDRQTLLPAELREDAPKPDTYQEQQHQGEQRRRIEGVLDRQLGVLQMRARSLLFLTAIEEVEPEIRKRLDSYLEGSRGHWHKGDRSYYSWATSAAQVLRSTQDDASELLLELADAAPAVTLTTAVNIWQSLGEVLLSNEPYRDLALGLLDRAVTTIEASEAPASERSDRIMLAAGLVDPYDSELGGDYYARAVLAASGLDDDGAALLSVNARLAVSCGSDAGDAAPVLAERLARAVEGYVPFVTDPDLIPYGESVEGVTALHPPAGLALATRWESEDRYGLDSSIVQVARQLVTRGFTKPGSALELLGLAGESQFPVSAAVELLEVLRLDGARSRTQLANALRELSTRVCRDLLPSARLRAAPTLAAWLREHNLQTLAGAAEIVELAEFAKTLQHDPTNGDGTRFSDADERRQRADTVLNAAHRDDPSDLASRLAELVDSYAGESRLTDYLIRVGEALSPAKRVAALEALGSIPADDPLWRFHAEALLRALSTWLHRWKSAKAVGDWICEHLAALVRDRFPSFVAYDQLAETTLPLIMSLPGLDDPAGLLIKAIGPNLSRLNAAQLYAVTTPLGLSLKPDEQVDVLDWSLSTLENDKPPMPPTLPTDEAPTIAAFLWAVLGHPDRRVRWRAAHVARALLCAPSPSLGNSLVALLDARDAGAFSDEKQEFLWMSAQLWLLLVLARVADESPGSLAGHERRFAEFATDAGWPHAASRELAIRSALRLDDAGGRKLPEALRMTLSEINRPVACIATRGRHFDLGDGRHDDTERRFRFDSMDTMPYWYSPLGHVFALDASEIASMAEVWIIDRLGFTEDGVQQYERETAERYEYQDTGHRHGGAPRVERLRLYLEYHAMLLVAGELIAEGRPVSVDVYEPADDPWDYWLLRHLDASPDLWLADRRSPAPLLPSTYGDLGSPDVWRERSGDDFDDELGLRTSEDEIVVDSYRSVSNRELHGSSFVTSALVGPGTSSALLRALQTCTDPNDFRLPEVVAGYTDEMEIDAPGFRLRGWLFELREDRENLEESDPLRRIDGGLTEPGPEFIDHHGLARSVNGLELNARSGTRASRIELWSDHPPSERGYDRASYAAGHRTWVRIPELLDFLEATQMDMVFEVRITRNYAEAERKTEEKYELGQSRIYLLRGAGALETLDRIGQLGRADRGSTGP